MAILISKKTAVLVQGITGKEGMRATEEMLKYGTHVVAGVVPGKGGERVHGVPVYNTVIEAYKKHKVINASLVTIPALFARDATLEAIEAGIPLVNILTEQMRVQDVAYILAHARTRGTTIVGPSSVGILVPKVTKMGSIGSSTTATVFNEGLVGLVSKSGGMLSEIASTLKKNNIGISTAIGIGGDRIIGFDFVDALAAFLKDDGTDAVVIFGEIGGVYEEMAAEYMMKSKYVKSVVVLVAGRFADSLPQGTALGHAGAIIEGNRGRWAGKRRAFKRAGAHIADTVEEIPVLLKKILK